MVGRQPEPAPPGPCFQALMDSAKYFLSHRNFAISIKYADKAQDSSPGQPGPIQIIVISTVLSAAPSSTRPGQPDWYAIINLPRFTQDQNLIWTRLASLANLLNSEKNPYPFAAEARWWVLKAGSVLTDPDSKAQFDDQLKLTPKGNENGGGGFWTMCPYCYFMYQYEKKYKECVLRCQNPNCRRAFTAVAIAASAVPPPEVVKEGKYNCYGFSPLGPNSGNGVDTGGEKGKNWWAPFVSMGQVRTGEERVDVKPNVGPKREQGNGFIEISDDEAKGKGETEREEHGNGVNGGEVKKRRVKMAARRRKKLTEKGSRVVGNSSLSEEGRERVGVRASVNEANANTSGEELVFSAGDDDIFAAVNPYADLGCEKLRNG